jgi:heat-inducible transcriptional repressor
MDGAENAMSRARRKSSAALYVVDRFYDWRRAFAISLLLVRGDGYILRHHCQPRCATLNGIQVVAISDAVAALDERSKEIFRRIVEGYLETGEPLGSRSLSRILPMSLSPASVRNVMSDLEELGLVYSPHVSAGRLPTQIGLRFFVDAFMQVGDLSPEDRANIDRQVRAEHRDSPMEAMMNEASRMLSGISRGAGLVITSKNDPVLKHVEFIRLEPTKALAVLVGDHDQVENRIIELPAGVTSSQLTEAANFLNAHMTGQTLPELRTQLGRLKENRPRELDALSPGSGRARHCGLVGQCRGRRQAGAADHPRPRQSARGACRRR